MRIRNSHYSMLIQWSDDDQVFVVSLPEFGESCKSHGSTYEEAVKNGRQVLELLIDAYQAEGKKLPTPATPVTPVSA
jgi:predicted RNase H-like HicB family nuclease